MIYTHGTDDPSKIFIIYHKTSLKQLGQWNYRNKLYSSKRAAKAALTVAIKNKRANKDDWEVTDVKNFNENIDHLVDTYNMLNPEAGPIKIRKSELGGPCDPSTNRYHEM